MSPLSIGPPGDRGALHCHWNAIATQLGHVPFSPRGLLQSIKNKVGLAAAKAAALRINLNVRSCSVVAPPMHAPSRTSLFLPLLLSQNLPFPRVHYCVRSAVLGKLVHTRLSSSYLIAHVLHCPPSPPAHSFIIGTAVIEAVINTHTLLRVKTFVQSPTPPRPRGSRVPAPKGPEHARDQHP